jgi:hypothetical protein
MAALGSCYGPSPSSPIPPAGKMLYTSPKPSRARSQSSSAVSGIPQKTPLTPLRCVRGSAGRLPLVVRIYVADVICPDPAAIPREHRTLGVAGPPNGRPRLRLVRVGQSGVPSPLSYGPAIWLGSPSAPTRCRKASMDRPSTCRISSRAAAAFVSRFAKAQGVLVAQGVSLRHQVRRDSRLERLTHFPEQSSVAPTGGQHHWGVEQVQAGAFAG